MPAALSRHPVATSLLLGVFLLGPAYWLLLAGMPGYYQRWLAGLPGLPLICTRSVTETITELGWAWLASGVGWSYWRHTRHLVRSTPAGYRAYVLMWLLYAWAGWLATLLPDTWPDDIVPGREPFFG